MYNYLFSMRDNTQWTGYCEKPIVIQVLFYLLWVFFHSDSLTVHNLHKNLSLLSSWMLEGSNAAFYGYCFHERLLVVLRCCVLPWCGFMCQFLASIRLSNLAQLLQKLWVFVERGAVAEREREREWRDGLRENKAVNQKNKTLFSDCFLAVEAQKHLRTNL